MSEFKPSYLNFISLNVFGQLKEFHQSNLSSWAIDGRRNIHKRVEISVKHLFLQDFINQLIRECNHELEKFPPIISNMQELQRRKDIKGELEKHRQGK